MRQATIAAVCCLTLACKQGSPPAVARPADAGPKASAPAPAPVVASCTASAGPVQVRRAGATYWEEVSVGTVFRAGDWVKTGKAGSARIEFTAGGGLELAAEAVVVIDTPEPPPEADGGAAAAAPMISLESGEARAFMMDLSQEGEVIAPLTIKGRDGARVKLERPKGEQAVEVRLRGDEGGTEVAVTRGAVLLTSSDGGERTIARGQVTDVRAGAASAPVELISFPDSIAPGIDARFWTKPELQIKLVWRAVTGAAGYRLQIAGDLSFQALLQSIDFGEEVTSYAFVPPHEGVYAWHVAARDAAGHWGEFGFARRVYLESEKPKELLIGPEDGALITFIDSPPKVVFSWQSAADVKSYRLVIGSGPDILQSAVVSLKTSGQRVEVSDLPPGQYVWGAFIEGKLLQPIFLEPRRLTLRKGEGDKLRTPKKINQWGD